MPFQPLPGEEERQRSHLWQALAFLPPFLLLVIAYYCLWPLGQLFEAWGTQPDGSFTTRIRPPGASALWLEESLMYLTGLLDHPGAWTRAIWQRFLGGPMQLIGLPSPLALAALSAGFLAGATLTAWLLHRNPYEQRYKSKGEARWATRRDLIREGLFDRAGLILGEWPENGLGATLKRQLFGHRPRYLRNESPLSILMIAPPGSGKSVMIKSMILASWPEKGTEFGPPSMVINDPKGEHFDDTSGWRATLGPIFKLAWSDTKGHAWNPLDPRNLSGGREAMALQATLVEKLNALFSDRGNPGGRRALNLILRTMLNEGPRWLERLPAEAERGGLAMAPDAAAALYRLDPDLIRHSDFQTKRQNDIDRLADFLITDDIEKHWRETGRVCLKGMIGFNVARCLGDPERYGDPTFGKLIDWMTGVDGGIDVTRDGALPGAKSAPPRNSDDGTLEPGGLEFEDPAQSDKVDGDLVEQLFRAAIAEALREGYPDRVISDLNETVSKPVEERGSVVSTALSAISMFKNPAIRARTSSSSFTLDDLRGMRDANGKTRPVTVYMVIPLGDAEMVGRISGMFFEAAANFLISQDEPKLKKMARAREALPVTFIADEFWTLPPSKALVQIPALGRSYLTQILIVGQAYRQIDLRYKDQGATLDTLRNAINRFMILQQNDEKVAKDIESQIGAQTLMEKSSSRNVGLGARNSFSRNESSRLVGEPLIRAQQIKALERLDPRAKTWGKLLLLIEGRFHRPALVRPACWFRNPELHRRGSLPPAPVDSVEILTTETSADVTDQFAFRPEPYGLEPTEDTAR